MISKKRIKQVVDQIVEGCRPEKIILLGSYGYGKLTKDSGLDIFVIAEIAASSPERIRIVRRAIKERGFDIDLVVRTSQEVDRSLRGRDGFIQEVVEKGKVVYARRDS